MNEENFAFWLIAWFWRYINLFRIILYQEVWESRLLYFHINVFVLLFLYSFLNGPIKYE